MIEFKCHACGTLIRVRDEFAGKQGKCPQCQTILDVPQALGMTPVPPMLAPPRIGGNGQAVAALVLGIVSIIPCIGIITAILAFVFGIMAISRKAGRGMAIAGLFLAVMGIVAQRVGPESISRYFSEKARNTMCGTNLNGIGKALAIYKADNNGSYPFIRDLKTGMKFDTPMNDGGKSSPYELGNGANLNNLENLNLLLDATFVAFKQFRCPSVSSDVMDRSGNGHEYGFRSGKQCYIDYAYQIGYANVGGATNAAPLTSKLDSSVAIMADKPGKDFTQDFGKGNKGDGFAHQDRGVNVLYADLAVKWSDKTFYAGYGKNNIYTRDMTKDQPPNVGSLISPSPAVVDVPQCQYDSVLFWGFK